MNWPQTYYLFGHGIALSAAIASLPIVVVLLLLGVLRKAAWIAGLCGLGTALLVALAVYRMPPGLAISSVGYGAAFGLFPISWIVFWAIVLFRLTVETGQFAIIKDSVGRLTEDPRLQALLIAFAFGAFIEGAAGFGTPVAITAAMLTGLGFSSFRASAICLLANTAPVAFGSIAIPIITLAGITGLPVNALSAAVGRFCAPVSLIVPAYLILAIGGPGALSAVWVPALVAGVVFGSVQFLVSTFIGPQLTDILASLAAMATLMVTYRVWKPRAGKQDYARFREGSDTPPAAPHFEGAALKGEEALLTQSAVAPSRGKVLFAWVPYLLLVICVLLWGFVPFQKLLNTTTSLFPWPMLHDRVLRMTPIVLTPSPYHAIFTFNFLSASGTSCMVATLLSAVVLRVSPMAFVRLLLSVSKQLILPTVTVTSVLAMAFLMNYSGATATLGIAFAATGALFPFFSPLLGWLGVFLTGSDTSSNALFGNLQVITADRLGFHPLLMTAANSSGGVMGKMISLQNIAVAAAATGLSGRDQSQLFRFSLKHSILLACVIGCMAMLYAYVFHF